MLAIDEAHALQSYESVEAILDDYRPDHTAPTSAQVLQGALYALRVARTLRTDWREYLPRLPGFALAQLERLTPLAWATWHCVSQLDVAEEASAGARVSRGLVEGARRRLQRMTEVLAHHLGHDTSVASEVRSLGFCRSDIEVSMGLSRLAQLYAYHEGVLALEMGPGAAREAEAARRDALSIELALDGCRDLAVERWRERLGRCWVALCGAHQEVRVAVLEFWGDAPALIELLPSLGREPNLSRPDAKEAFAHGIMVGARPANDVARCSDRSEWESRRACSPARFSGLGRVPPVESTSG